MARRVHSGSRLGLSLVSENKWVGEGVRIEHSSPVKYTSDGTHARQGQPAYPPLPSGLGDRDLTFLLRLYHDPQAGRRWSHCVYIAPVGNRQFGSCATQQFTWTRVSPNASLQSCRQSRTRAASGHRKITPGAQGLESRGRVKDANASARPCERREREREAV